MAEPDRLVRRPTFLLSSIRSGSTLLRCLLNSHPMICAPHELHLRYVAVTIDSDYAALGMSLLGYEAANLQRLLWDRILHTALASSGKAVIVDKSPSNVWIQHELRACWPDARFIVLRRHPADIAASIASANDGRNLADAIKLVNRFGETLDAVVTCEPDTPIVHYENLIVDPAAVCRRLCGHLGVPYHPPMLDYGRHDHGPFVYGVGDWGERIRSGRVLNWRRPDELHATPSGLIDLSHRWGYEVPPAGASR